MHYLDCNFLGFQLSNSGLIEASNVTGELTINNLVFCEKGLSLSVCPMWGHECPLH